MKKLGSYGYQNLCCEYGWFTCGCNEQYETVTYYAMTLTPEDARHCSYQFEAVVYMTWICSDTEYFTVNDIRAVLYDKVLNI